MQSEPLVSIIMPIYKVEKYIEKSVKSVIEQSYKNIELILVDDGSPDKSADIAESVLKENSYPYKLIRQENKGLGEARNTGVQNSGGEWILFLDSDDIIIKDTVEHLVKAIGENADLVFSRYNMITSQEDINENISIGKCTYLAPKEIQNGFLLRNYVILAAGTLFRRKLFFEENIFFGKMPWSEDQHFIWRLLAVVNGAVFLDEPLYQYLKRPGSIMTSSSINNVINSYPAICDLPRLYNNNLLVKNFLVSRWVLGTISSTSKISDYKNWGLLYESISGQEHMKTLLRFPSIKTKARAIACLISKRAYYALFSKRGSI
ncbi:MAG: glycosyltransferase family 2 protein [Clostridia bacterium]|nr:glycosyltransferase family 2 protein [Clostridia bacterium]